MVYKFNISDRSLRTRVYYGDKVGGLIDSTVRTVTRGQNKNLFSYLIQIILKSVDVQNIFNYIKSNSLIFNTIMTPFPKKLNTDFKYDVKPDLLSLL